MIKMRVIENVFILLGFFIFGNWGQVDKESRQNGNFMMNQMVLGTFNGRIVNGTRASIGQFPHQVSLRRSYSDGHFCGGSIIAEEWILTAAHCMFLFGEKILPWSISVIAGQLKLFPLHEFNQRRSVGAIIIHPLFHHDTLTNDIALLKLTVPLDLTAMYVSAAKLQEKLPKIGSMCQVSGWGYLTEADPVVSNDLMYVSLPLVSRERCQELMINYTDVPLGMFCAGYEEGLRDACQGDSGGGMMCGNFLTGVVSGGEGCARPRLLGLYSEVSHYLTWIQYQMINFNGIMEINNYDYYSLRLFGRILRWS